MERDLRGPFTNEIGKQVFISGLNELNAGLNTRRKLSEQDWNAYNRRLTNGTIVHEVDCGCRKCLIDNDYKNDDR